MRHSFKAWITVDRSAHRGKKWKIKSLFNWYSSKNKQTKKTFGFCFSWEVFMHLLTQSWCLQHWTEPEPVCPGQESQCKHRCTELLPLLADQHTFVPNYVTTFFSSGQLCINNLPLDDCPWCFHITAPIPLPSSQFTHASLGYRLPS